MIKSQDGNLKRNFTVLKAKILCKSKENGSEDPLLRETMRKIEIKTFRIWNCQISQKCVKEGN